MNLIISAILPEFIKFFVIPPKTLLTNVCLVPTTLKGGIKKEIDQVFIHTSVERKTKRVCLLLHDVCRVFKIFHQDKCAGVPHHTMKMKKHTST